MAATQRTLGLSTTIALVVGGVIGSGIFMKPAVMAAQLGSPLLLVSVWVVAGIITLFGALSNAEVAALFPETGGQYVFFQKMYGEGFAFLYGWAALAVFNTAGNASIAYVFAQYADYFLHLPRLHTALEQSTALHIPWLGTFYVLENLGVKLLTIFIVLVFTLINARSVAWGGGILRALTALKTVAMAALIVGILGSGKGNITNFTTTTLAVPSGVGLLTAYMAAIAGAFWAYDGWNNITFIAGEIKEPQRNIPRSLLVGLLTCIGIYVLINLSYLYVLPISAIAKSSFVASDAGSVVWIYWGGSLLALMVALSTLGTANANILSTARVTYAMGTQHSLLSGVGKLHPTYQTPRNALWANALWSSVLIMSGSFDMLTDMLIFVSWFFYGMSAVGVIVLRLRYPHLVRPYKAWGFPFTTLLFIAFTFTFLIVTCYNDLTNYQQGKAPIINALLGIAITSLGIPLYWWGKRKPA